jgi:hypothetical protein
MTPLEDSWDDDLDDADSLDDPHALDATFPFGGSYPLCSDRFGNPLTHEEILARGPSPYGYFDDGDGEDDDDPWGGPDGLDGFDELDDDELPVPWTVLCTAEDVHEHLLGLIGPERDGPRALWVVFLDAGDRVQPLVIPITGVPTIVDRRMVANLASTLRTLVDQNAPGGSVAFGLVRRGGGDRGTFEAGWADALHEGLGAVGVPVRAVVAIGRDRSRVLPLGRVA